MVKASGFLFMAWFLAILACAEDVAPAEKRFVELINKARSALGRPAVEADPALTRVARSHSFEMVSLGFVGHRSPTTGTAKERLQEAKIGASKVVEHISQGADAETAHKQLMESNEYRNNILERAFRQVGVGIVSNGKGGYLFTILLTVPVNAADTGEAVRKVLGAVNAKRRTEDAPELELHQGLTDLALKVCQSMNEKGALLGDDVVKAGIGSAGLPYLKYRSFYRFTEDLDSVLSVTQLYDPAFRRVGLAVLRNEHPRKTIGFYWVTVILVQPK
jgi:uncharacterized protein YkwD